MAKVSISVSFKARDDLKEIGRYTSKKWGREQRDKYLAGIFRSFDQLASDELVTTECLEVREGYRKYYIGRHIVFFRRFNGSIEIVRILHHAMDVESHLP